jgi:hypothetical protein
MAQNHLDAIQAKLQATGGPNESLVDHEIPVAAVLAIGPAWALAADNQNDPNCGCMDSPEWDDVLDDHYAEFGPCTVEHNGYLYVLAGDWKYPIYFRFEPSSRRIEGES